MIHPEDQLVLFRHPESGCLLWAPKSFLRIPHDELSFYYNGCGPRGYSGVIPQSVLGLKIFYLCYIHDHMYERCCCEEDEIVADGIFAMNLILWIWHHSSWYSMAPRFVSSAKFMYSVSATTFSKEYWSDNLEECPLGRRYAITFSRGAENGRSL